MFEYNASSWVSHAPLSAPFPKPSFFAAFLDQSGG